MSPITTSILGRKRPKRQPSATVFCGQLLRTSYARKHFPTLGSLRSIPCWADFCHLINRTPTLQTHASTYFKTETQAKSVTNPSVTDGDVLSSLLKTGNCRRPKSKIDLNKTQCEVSVPIFQQTIKQIFNRRLSIKTEARYHLKCLDFCHTLCKWQHWYTFCRRLHEKLSQHGFGIESATPKTQMCHNTVRW